MAIELHGGLLVVIECSNMLSIRIVESGKVWGLRVPWLSGFTSKFQKLVTKGLLHLIECSYMLSICIVESRNASDKVELAN